MGCGRVFEGGAAQMHANRQRLARLPEEAKVYCAHEYTLANGRFALTVEPDNEALRQRMAGVEAMRAAGEATVPTTIALERATNPFMRAESRSEEHTSELQSLMRISYAVFCLKKKHKQSSTHKLDNTSTN